MRSFSLIGEFVLLILAVEINGQGPPFESPPWGWVQGSNCARVCDGRPMNCFFHFRLETSYTLSKACFNCPTDFNDCFRPDCIIGGGIRRMVSVINRQLPGPSIDVCEGDKIKVLLENMLESGESTSIHWHGQHMRNGDQYMDGVPYITQCPIKYNNNFTYDFTAATPGTHFYHSHVELQRGDGVFGALIVRQTPRDNLHFNLYNSNLPEHMIVINDWNDRPRMEVFQAYAKAGAFMEPTGILINGYGDQMNNNIRGTPMAQFTVRRGTISRFRLINANFFDCPVEVSIDNHKLTVISSDGEDVRPQIVDSIVSHSGERFDFLLNANQAVSTYYIRAKGTLLCERLETFQLATLRYEGSTRPLGTGTPTYQNAADPNGIALNPISPAARPNAIRIDSLRSMKASPNNLNTNNVRRFFVSLDMSGIDHPSNHRSTVYGFNQVAPDQQVRTPQLNHISFKSFDFTMMQYRHMLSSEHFCTAESMGAKCERDFCECPHVLEINQGEVVEMVVFDEMDQTSAPAVHPMHLHGQHFWVLNQMEIGPNLTRPQFINNHGNLPRNFENAPLKDTVSVPRGGVVILRFIADNLGFWLMHCHIDVHSAEGMEVVIKVGSNTQIPDPPLYFPTCGNFLN